MTVVFILQLLMTPAVRFWLQQLSAFTGERYSAQHACHVHFVKCLVSSVVA